jgi:formylglycine-generating enzyme required for sulfatase activity
MAKIFLSYRRQDSAGVAGRIYDRLRQHFGDDAVFMDIDTIPFGEDFREHIGAAVGQCEAVLAVIGSKWTGRTKARRRIDDPKDFVRVELESALKRNIPVIPILIDHARMPGEGDLPTSLARLAFLNAVEVDQGRDFHPHVDRLIRGIEFHFRKSSSGTAKPAPGPVIPGAEPKVVSASPVKRLTNSVGMILVEIGPGEFLMGTNKDQVNQLMRQFPDSEQGWFDDEVPQHLVTISRTFFLGIHPVAQGQYQAVMGSNPGHFKGPEELPVESVSWFDAIKFCNKLSKRERRKPYYQINGDKVGIVAGGGYRLPTEAEWEYACRASTLSLFPFDGEASRLGEYAWYKSNADRATHPVGQKRPNSWGLYDMLGNVWEWCADGYESKYYASSPAADPPGSTAISHRVIRGGSWVNNPRDCRSTCRSKGVPESRYSFQGLRVARGHG